MTEKKKRKYTMSKEALLQRQTAPLKHGRRSPVLVSLGKKFGCTKPNLHTGEEGKYDPDNCDFCRLRQDQLVETRALLGSVSENLMERAATTKIDMDEYREKLIAEGKHPLEDRHYYNWAKLDLELAKYLADKATGSHVNIFHHKMANKDEEDKMVIDITAIEDEG